jgi:hypothetical protein
MAMHTLGVQHRPNKGCLILLAFLIIKLILLQGEYNPGEGQVSAQVRYPVGLDLEL